MCNNVEVFFRRRSFPSSKTAGVFFFFFFVVTRNKKQVVAPTMRNLGHELLTFSSQQYQSPNFLNRWFVF